MKFVCLTLKKAFFNFIISSGLFVTSFRHFGRKILKIWEKGPKSPKKSWNFPQLEVYETCFNSSVYAYSLGTLMIVMCSVKMFRSAFSDSPKQYLVVTFTVFFFKYDYRTASETFIVDYFFMAILFTKVSENIRFLLQKYRYNFYHANSR